MTSYDPNVEDCEEPSCNPDYDPFDDGEPSSVGQEPILLDSTDLPQFDVGEEDSVDNRDDDLGDPPEFEPILHEPDDETVVVSNLEEIDNVFDVVGEDTFSDIRHRGGDDDDNSGDEEVWGGSVRKRGQDELPELDFIKRSRVLGDFEELSTIN